MASQNSQTVLVTGGNGFLGVAVTLKALESGLHVVSAVRRQDAVDHVAGISQLKPYVSNGTLTFKIVPDITTPDAFTDAAKGCAFIVHTASPLGTKDFGDLRDISVGGTNAVLAAAEANPSVKRVVITSSIYALQTWEEFFPDHPHNQAAMAGKFDEVPMIKMDEIPRLPDPPTPESSATANATLHRYITSKVAARNAVLDYFQTEKPHFNVVHFMPGYILGPSIGSLTKEDWALNTTNMLLSFMLWPFPTAFVWGLPEGSFAPIGTWTCHINDCADAHVTALTKSGLFTDGEEGGTCKEYLMFSDGPHGPRWTDAVTYVKEDLPDIAKDIPFAGTLDSIPQNFDSSPVEEEILGRKLLPYRRQVRDAMTQWHALPASTATTAAAAAAPGAS